MENEKQLKTTAAQRRASVKWQKENYKRIPLDVPFLEYEKIKAEADSAGESVNGYIKKAINNRMQYSRALHEIPPEIITKTIKFLRDSGMDHAVINDLICAWGLPENENN